MRKSLLHCTFAATLIWSLMPTERAFADSVLDRVDNALSDPLGIVETMNLAYQLVERVRFHADGLLDDADVKVNTYLNRINAEVEELKLYAANEIDDATEDFNKILTEKLNQVQDLEKSFIKDTRDLVKCASVESADTLRRTLADMLNDIGARNPSLEVFGFKVSEVKIEYQNIPSPVKGWEAVVRALETELSSLSSGEKYTNITNVYDEVVRQSDQIKCFYYEDSVSWTRIQLVQLEYRRRSRAWANVLF